ncbi:c-type cytochrome [Amphritea japonica]|uniref:Cytochrome c n=1 Tax=Amphritea japonica ATCC BAA-1530 TaxID=1278309 RepID=A0A7R6P326_9GAMM|nr:cytochrome c [Amphritea japonica]BBB24939.1 cytochrome c [Amphritea japonica ATCC BAA-1530]
MKKSGVLLLWALILGAAGWFSLPLLANNPELQLNAGQGDVSRGAYLARASGCIACHTDTKGGGAPLAGGAPLETEFGSFSPPNLTTDKDSGIGDWSLEQFATALRHGLSPSGEPYYPAFPYEFYASLSDQDIADLWAAFQTVPPVAQDSPEHQLGFPFNLRRGVFLWQTLFFEEQSFTADSGKDGRYNRGKFLAESAAHCAACHSPRNLLGALDDETFYTGGASALAEESKVPPITAKALAEAGWSEADLGYALKTGVKADGDVFGGSMAEVVREGTSYLQQQDLNAIAYYLINRSE